LRYFPVGLLARFALIRNPGNCGVQRSGDARAPLPNSSIEQWLIVVIVIAYTLFVTSQYDVIFTFANECFGEVC